MAERRKSHSNSFTSPESKTQEGSMTSTTSAPAGYPTKGSDESDADAHLPSEAAASSSGLPYTKEKDPLETSKASIPEKLSGSRDSSRRPSADLPYTNEKDPLETSIASIHSMTQSFKEHKNLTASMVSLASAKGVAESFAASAIDDGFVNFHNAGDSEDEHESDTDDALVEREDELRQEVPDLLDKMNTASSDVNSLERQAEETQIRYRQLLSTTGRLYEDLRAQYGSAIDRARPYFEAAQALSGASKRVQGAVREFSTAASSHAQAKQELRDIEERLAYGAHKVTLDKDQQSGLSTATVRVLRCQTERDRSEQEYARALREYQDAQEQAEAQRAKAGDSVIRRALPCFRQLQAHQQELERVRRVLGEVNERIRASKTLYNSSLRGLDRINVAVHDARKQFLERKSMRESEVTPGNSSNGQSMWSPSEISAAPQSSIVASTIHLPSKSSSEPSLAPEPEQPSEDREGCAVAESAPPVAETIEEEVVKQVGAASTVSTSASVEASSPLLLAKSSSGGGLNLSTLDEEH